MQGDTVYSKVVCEGICKLEAYVEEIATGGSPPTAVNIDPGQEDVLKLWNAATRDQLRAEGSHQG